MVRMIARWPLVRFAGVGGINTAVHLSVFTVVRPVLPYWMAHAAATVLAMSCSYLLNCKFTFGVLPCARSLLLYPVSHVGSLTLSTAAMSVLVGVAGIDARAATLAGGVVALPLTYLLSRGALTGGIRKRVTA